MTPATGTGDGGPAATASGAYRVQFDGSGKEFFRIWAVGMLLTLATLGWRAAVAQRRSGAWFRSHTRIAGSPLDHMPAGGGRRVPVLLLLAVLYVGFRAATQTQHAIVAASLAFAAALLVPYAWGRAMRMRVDATGWRGVPLRFSARWGEVYRASGPVFVLAASWVAASLAAAAVAPPAEAAKGLGAFDAQTLRRLAAIASGSALVTILCLSRLEFDYRRLLVGGTQYGSEPAHWSAAFRDVLRIWGTAVLVFVPCALVAGGALALTVRGWMAALAPAHASGAAHVAAVVALVVGSVLLLLLASAPARAYREGAMFRLAWNHTGVGEGMRFECDLDVRRYVLLRVRNQCLVLLTLGLFRPFARVGEYRMKAQSLTLRVFG